MRCPSCSSESFVGSSCFQCGWSPRIGPGADTDRSDPAPSPHGAPPPESIGAATWKELCPICEERTFDGHDCSNPSCKYGIPLKHRTMQPCTMSPDAAGRLRQRLGIP